MKKIIALVTLIPLAACDAGLGASRIGDTITRTGTLNCTEGSPQEIALVVGTERDPVRCGPQSQGIPR